MSNKKKKSKKEETIKTNLDILNIREYDEELNAFKLADGSFLDFFEIVARDRQNLQDDAVRFDIITLTRFERLFSPDHKDIGLNFPINTAVQRRNLERKRKLTNDPVRRKWLEREIDELLTLDSNIDRKEFYRMYFGETKEELIKNRTNILSWIGRGRNKIIKEIDKEKKIQIIRKLCNMNALILPDELREDIDYED
ncbi:hypothetical protein [Mogibacterium timidum]|uniref:Uncharacterized protein n=1 Tax=Mogibacterium timidum ATCC 33093 TaxID=1401079 RepID=X8IPW4_9FIRM|nr:hypothetical protein [Mogibacterium timidum]EUC52148.1 hypothetical protein HMPREF0581_0314 [Mogibacterium timidum ATCC 33093]